MPFYILTLYYSVAINLKSLSELVYLLVGQNGQFRIDNSKCSSSNDYMSGQDLTPLNN